MDHIEHQVPNVSFETQHSFSLGTVFSDPLVTSNAKIFINPIVSNCNQVVAKTLLVHLADY